MVGWYRLMHGFPQGAISSIRGKRRRQRRVKVVAHDSVRQSGPQSVEGLLTRRRSREHCIFLHQLSLGLCYPSKPLYVTPVVAPQTMELVYLLGGLGYRPVKQCLDLAQVGLIARGREYVPQVMGLLDVKFAFLDVDRQSFVSQALEYGPHIPAVLLH